MATEVGVEATHQRLAGCSLAKKHRRVACKCPEPVHERYRATGAMRKRREQTRVRRHTEAEWCAVFLARRSEVEWMVSEKVGVAQVVL